MLDCDATCGFGVSYRNIHASNESASVADIPTGYRVNRDAVRELLRAQCAVARPDLIHE